jgi:UDP-N-acetylglucosamine/UDP-N-acetylgalactosamine diphosphorylase
MDVMRCRGIEYLHYHQVDNPTARVCEPAFLGFHARRQSEMSTKVVAKTSPGERMGLVVDVDGKTQIVEYIHVPDDVARQTDADGRLLLWAGSTAIHVFNRSFLERVISDAALPFQVARKKVPHIDDAGDEVAPQKENAFKFERFIFDAMPLAKRALVVEGDRAAEFNPVKNADGADSPGTAQRAMSALHANWLRAAGAEVAPDAVVEICPLFALGPEELRGKLDPTHEYTGAIDLR